MTKYIIKNCPALLISGICNGRNVKGIACKNNTDCLLKKLVEESQKAIKIYENEEFYEDDCHYFCGQSNFAETVLEQLEIEECKQ